MACISPDTKKNTKLISWYYTIKVYITNWINNLHNNTQFKWIHNLHYNLQFTWQNKFELMRTMLAKTFDCMLWSNKNKRT